MGALEDLIAARDATTAKAHAEAARRAAEEQAAQDERRAEVRSLVTDFVRLAQMYAIPLTTVYVETYDVRRVFAYRHLISGVSHYDERETLQARQPYCECWLVADGVYITQDAMRLRRTYAKVERPGTNFGGTEPNRMYRILGWEPEPFYDSMTTMPDGDAGHWPAGLVSEHMADLVRAYRDAAEGRL